MLHEFLSANQAELAERCRAKAAYRDLHAGRHSGGAQGIPGFIGLLIDTLVAEQPRRSASPAATPGLPGVPTSAALHGRQMSALGFTAEQVVHEYGNLCQAITDLALERDQAVSVEEFRTLNRCLDEAIAEAITEYTLEQQSALENSAARDLHERLGFLAHEIRNHIHTATLALLAIRSGRVGLTGTTGAVLDRSLIGMRSLIDRCLADVRVSAGMSPRHQPLRVADFIADIRLVASLEAQSRGCTLSVGEVDGDVGITVDREMLFSAVGNLLQNAFKYTRRGTQVTLGVHAESGRIQIEVGDHCGGLPTGASERMFLPFQQVGDDRSGMGLGLAICRRSVEANCGTLRVRDLPGVGCVFAIELPAHRIPAA